jgi:hypothetical protein
MEWLLGMHANEYGNVKLQQCSIFSSKKKNKNKKNKKYDESFDSNDRQPVLPRPEAELSWH